MQLVGDSVRRHYDLHALSLAAQPLLCSAITGLEQVGGGGNNRLYRIRAADGACYALKTYLAEARDCRDRIGAECDGLNFAWAHGLRQVPHVVGADRDAGLALFEWIDGTQIAEPRDGDIDDALGLLGDLHAISKLPEARTLALASEACLSAAELSRQIAGRRARLMATADPRLLNFFEAGFDAAWDSLEGRAHRGFEALGLEFESVVPGSWRTLSPSDFGFHNALRRDDGTLAFLDFEYFGWDDPVKLVADFLLHPGMRLGPAQRRWFRQGAASIYSEDGEFGARLRLLYPLYGLRWCLILLNPFLPERWRRQAYASANAEPGEVQRRQLIKAEAMLAKAIQCEEGFPHDV